MAIKPTNSRAAWKQSMPPLAEAFADFKGFAKDEVRVNRIYDLLATFIQSHRGRVARRFYPTRELAKFFGVSRFPIATVFQRLQREGLLTLLRGSQTMIPARIQRTRIPVRGIVAMPIWMPGFFCFVDWRRWCSIVQKELARHRFAAEPVFFTIEEKTNQSSFVDRVLKFNPDYILWFCPGKGEINAIRGFTDAGVPVLTVSGPRDHFPARVYPASQDEALRQGLQSWQESGAIDEIIVSSGPPQGPFNETLRSALKTSSLPHRVEAFSWQKSDLPKYLERLMSRPRRGIVFDDDLLYATMCLWEPEAMLKLLRRQRIITQRHVMILSDRSMEGITIDLLDFRHEQLARRIAQDLSQAKGGIASRQPTFHAAWRPQTPLTEVAQTKVVE